MTRNAQLAITAVQPGDMPMPNSTYLPELFLICDDRTSIWHLAVWGGAEWHDPDSGEPLTPSFVARLPSCD